MTSLNGLLRECKVSPYKTVDIRNLLKFFFHIFSFQFIYPCNEKIVWGDRVSRSALFILVVPGLAGRDYVDALTLICFSHCVHLQPNSCRPVIITPSYFWYFTLCIWWQLCVVSNHSLSRCESQLPCVLYSLEIQM